jgi:thioredoxin 1
VQCLKSKKTNIPCLTSRCKVISPIFEKLSEQYQHVEFYEVEVDAEDAIGNAANVRAMRCKFLVFSRAPWLTTCMAQMPTFVLFESGEKMKKAVGADL